MAESPQVAEFSLHFWMGRVLLKGSWILKLLGSIMVLKRSKLQDYKIMWHLRMKQIYTKERDVIELAEIKL